MKKEQTMKKALVMTLCMAAACLPGLADEKAKVQMPERRIRAVAVILLGTPKPGVERHKLAPPSDAEIEKADELTPERRATWEFAVARANFSEAKEMTPEKRIFFEDIILRKPLHEWEEPSSLPPPSDAEIEKANELTPERRALWEAAIARVSHREGETTEEAKDKASVPTVPQDNVATPPKIDAPEEKPTMPQDASSIVQAVEEPIAAVPSRSKNLRWLGLLTFVVLGGVAVWRIRKR